MIDDMTVRRMAEGTQQQYLSACARFIAFHQGKPPGLLGPDHVKSYQVHLVREKQLAWSTLNIHVCALRFLFCVTLGREWAVKHIVYPKLPKKLPVVLSLEEVEQFLEPIGNIKHRAMFVLAYATGLRLMEVATLKISNIDSRRMVIHVENGKGGQRSVCNVGSVPASSLAGILQGSAACWLAFFRRFAGETHHWWVPWKGLPEGLAGIWLGQEGDGSHAAAYFCDSPVGKRHQHTGHPGFAGPQQFVHHSHLHAHSCDYLTMNI